MAHLVTAKKLRKELKLSNRTCWKTEPNLLSQQLKSLQESKIKILDLSESNPTQCRFDYLNSELLASLTRPSNLCYEPHPNGLKKARTAIASDYLKKGISIDLERIFLTASTSEAYSFLFRLLANPGDRILVPQPSYPLFEFLADLNDVSLDSYKLFYEDGIWQIDFESILANCRSETKAIMLVHPNNPTGSFVKKKEFQKILKIAEEKSLALISDEVFSDYSFTDDSERLLSLAVNHEVLTFTLDGISKAFGLPQMKLAWFIANGPKEMLSSALKRLEIICDTYLSVNTPAQAALSSWFQHKEKIQDEIKSRIIQNRTFLLNQLKQPHSATCLQSEGGWYAILRLPKIQTEEEWALELLEKDHVYAYPGYFFDFESQAHIILSLLPHPTIFQEGVLRILARIKNK